jgi:hypothetical protein
LILAVKSRSWPRRITATAGGSAGSPVTVDYNIFARKILGLIFEIPPAWQDSSYESGLAVQIPKGTPFIPWYTIYGAEQWLFLDDFHAYVPMAFVLSKKNITETFTVQLKAYTTDPTNNHTAQVVIITED